MSLLPPSTASSTPTLLGVPFPPPTPPTSAHPLLSAAPLVPLRVLICNFTKRTHDHFHDLLEQLEQQPDELQRRHALLASLRHTQITLTRLRLLTSWLLERGEEYDRLGDIAAVLKQRDAAYGLSVDMLNLLARHVDASLPPAFDIPTAVHVLGTGDYRLLPRQIETVLDVKRVLSDTEIADIKRRLDDQLYIALLSSRLPPSLTVLSVRGGVARLGGGGWVATVSLRMMPRGDVEVSEQSRIKWRLFGIRWLLHVSGDPSDVAVVADAQTAALIGRCNALMHSSDEPLLLLHKTLQTFVHALTVALLNHQAINMQQHYAAHAINVDFIPAQSLAIRYWKEAQLIPQGDTSTPLSSSPSPSSPALSSSCLLFTLNGDQLNVTHSPPLPQLEAVGVAAASAVSFSIDPQSISLPRLFARVLASHARHRIQQLHAFLLRQSRAAGQTAWDSMAVVNHESETEQRMSEEEQEEEEEDNDDEDQHASVSDVLAIGLAEGWTVHVRVEQQSGRFVFSWTDVLPSAASSSTLASSMATLASLNNLSTLFASLHSLRHEARLLYYQHALASLHTGQTVLRFLPIQWTAAVPSPTSVSEASLVFVRLCMSPFFFLLLSFPISNGVLTPSLYFLHCEPVESPSSAAANAAPNAAASAAVKRKMQHCELLSPVSCALLSATELPALSSLPPNPTIASSSSASQPLALIYRALCYCEERVPAAVFLHQLPAFTVTNLVQLSASSFAFSTPYPPAPSKPQGEARITITIAPHVPYSDTSASSLSSIARYFPVSAASSDALLVSGARYGWSASVEQSALARTYREIMRQKINVHTRSLGMHFTHPDEATTDPSAVSSLSPPAVTLYYASMTASPLSSVFSDLLNLHICAQFTYEASGFFATPLDKFKQYDAITPGDQPPPGFFSVASCSTDSYALRYNLDRLDRDGGSDECWLVLRQRHSDLESGHYLHMGGRRAVVFTLHFSPYAFPHHDYLEWDFNHRFDLKTLLKHVYWGSLAAKHIHRFMHRVSAWDRAAGYHHLHFHQNIALTAPADVSAAPGQPAPQQLYLLSISPAVHTVNVLPESATRIRFLFRKQHKQTKVDIRLLNGYAFVQDFLSTTSSVAATADEKRQPPGRVSVRVLDSYLSSWYQWCGQYEQWKRVVKWQQAKHHNLPVSFDKVQLNSRPTDKVLIDIRLTENSGLRTSEADVLCRFYRQWVCVPPYSPECMQSFLGLCSLPLGVQRAMLELLQLQLSSHDSATSAATGRLAIRWVHHLAAPFDLLYQPSYDVLFIVVQLMDRRRGESVYLPLAYTVSTGMVALWENEQQETVTDNRNVTVRNDRKLRRLLPAVDTVSIGYGPSGDEWLRRERWSSLGAALSGLMALEMGEVVHAVTSSLSPPMTIDEWCQPTTSMLVSPDAIKAEQAVAMEAAGKRHLSMDIMLG